MANQMKYIVFSSRILTGHQCGYIKDAKIFG